MINVRMSYVYMCLKDNLRARRSLEVGAYDLAVRLAEDGTPVLLEAFFHRGELALARGREGAKSFSVRIFL